MVKNSESIKILGEIWFSINIFWKSIEEESNEYTSDVGESGMFWVEWRI